MTITGTKKVIHFRAKTVCCYRIVSVPKIGNGAYAAVASRSDD